VILAWIFLFQDICFRTILETFSLFSATSILKKRDPSAASTAKKAKKALLKSIKKETF